jgi:hypothetical protein
MSLAKILPFIAGLYIGKYHPQYVPLPQITKENFDKLLRYLEEATSRTATPPPPHPSSPQTR